MRLYLTDIEYRVPGSDAADRHNSNENEDKIGDLHVDRVGAYNESAVLRAKFYKSEFLLQ